jgi:hypothetical protein
MKFPCVITTVSGGGWCARHQSADVGFVEVTAATKEEALRKLRDELRYRLELCPCTGEAYRDLEVEVVEQAK